MRSDAPTKFCETCGCSLGEDHPFSVCPKCLFGEALKPRQLSAESSEISPSPPVLSESLSRLTARRDFFQKYELIEKIGGGGQGEIWKVWDYDFLRHVAMKRLSEASLADEPVLHRFLAEAQIASQLEHPGVLPIFDVGLDPDGRPFYTTQLLPGTTLADVWRQIHAPAISEWNINRALELLLHVCDVMAHAHSRGVVHRDLKPTNILVGAFGDVRVIDWGSAHILESALKKFEAAFVPLNQPVETDRSEAMLAEPNSPLATASSGQPVTILFTPPEIISGQHTQLGPETDIYSLGVILFQLLTGQPPYFYPAGEMPGRDELKKMILRGPPEPVRSVNPKASRDLAAICQKAMAHQKAARYPTMGGLANDIRAALEFRPVQARRPTPWLKLQKWAQRNSSYVLLGGFSLAVVCTMLLIGRSIMFQRDVARQVNALRDAELAARSGRWHQALADWDLAESGGYKDSIYLNLQRAEAWTILSEPARSETLLKRLSKQSNLGSRKGVVLLHLGEHELFDQATANQGIQHIREALASGSLETADELFGRGLLAESTPEALNLFHQAIQINSFHHGAHRHSLGLEFLLGRHADLQASLRFFAAIYPDDPSSGFLEAAELSMQDKLDAAKLRMTPLQSSVGNEEWKQLNTSLSLLATAAKSFDPDVWLTTSGQAMPSLDALTTARQVAGTGGDSTYSHIVSRMPFLPSVQKGLLEGRAALGNLMAPFIGNSDKSVARIKAAWQHHPEALVPALAGIYLASRQPTNGVKSVRLLRLQADLFQLAADSPSTLKGLDRTARYLAAKTEFDLLLTNPTNGVAMRQSCLGNIRQALASPEISLTELKAYFNFAMKLDQYDLARALIVRMEEFEPQDTSTLQARIDLELAAGNLDTAWELVNQRLASFPNDARALENRAVIQIKLGKVINLIHSQSPSNQIPTTP